MKRMMTGPWWAAAITVLFTAGLAAVWWYARRGDRDVDELTE